ncbi:MAG: hypothetical protein KAQ94_08765 [Arcobacteraceae bacterium]|nr:hypothetical protein [Arcobacteraceae bacterium]
MSDMSFKQARELVERLELTEITLRNTLSNIDKSSNNFKNSLEQQEQILQLVPKNDQKLNNMKVIVALNIGVIIGLLIGKYLL